PASTLRPDARAGAADRFADRQRMARYSQRGAAVEDLAHQLPVHPVRASARGGNQGRGQSQRGQVAVSAGQCGRRGVTTQNTHGSGDSLRYQVQFSDGKSFVRWYELERVSEKDETVFTLLNKRQFGRLT